MKKIFGVVCVLFISACDPVATCDHPELPEFCGSPVCEQAVACCESDDTGVLSSACQEVNDGLTEVPESVRQTARDVACEQLLTQAEENGVCSDVESDAGVEGDAGVSE